MQPEQMQACLDALLDNTLAAGADAADARIGTHSGMMVEVRSGDVAALEHEEGHSVSLRALIGRRQAHVSGSDLSEAGRMALVERVCAMAAAAPEDPWCGLAEPDALEMDPIDLHLEGDSRPDFAELEERARRAEAAALAVKGVEQTDHVSADWGRSETFMAASNGFRGRRAGGVSSLGVVVIAGQGDSMERDYEVRSERKIALMPDPEEIGRIAAERAVKRLNPRKIGSHTIPVIFDRRLSASLLQSFIGAIAGPSIARGVSFLKDRLGKAVFAPGIQIIDDPLRSGGHGSRAFDGEGCKVQKRALIEDGVLTQWILSGPSARQLGLPSNGFASSGFGDPPGVCVSNLDLMPGTDSPELLMRNAGQGLLVTDMFGPSINPNTGDYSVGVSGFWFEAGACAFPVSEVTLAGDLPSMFSRLIPGSVLEQRNSINAPDLLIDDMKLGGT